MRSRPTRAARHPDDPLSGLDELGARSWTDGPAPRRHAFVGSPPFAARAVAAGFDLVVAVGPGRTGLPPTADVVVARVDDLPADTNRWVDLVDEPAHALGCVDQVVAALDARPRLYLDFDGVLAPIVDDPDAAAPTPASVEALRRLAPSVPVAIVSGRGLDDVAARVPVDGLAVAGSHGFEVVGWDGNRRDHPDGVAALEALSHAEAGLRSALADAPGVMVERKRFAVAVHTRRAADDDVRRRAGSIVAEVAAESSGLGLQVGKEVHELRPDVGWDKGTTVADLTPDGDVPLYIGDDTTDEDALAVVRRMAGVGIHVGAPTRPLSTWASLLLADPDEVAALLGELAERLDGPA